MFALLSCLLLASATAQETTLPPEAGELEGEQDWKHKLYWEPIVGFAPMRQGGQVFFIGSGGAEAGVRYLNQETRPPLLGRTRARAVYSTALGSGAWGVDARVGSFIGPRHGILTVQSGPDLWYNFYRPSPSGYYLPPTVGLSLSNQAVVQPIDEIAIIAGANPGWVFARHRKAENLPIDELDLLAAVAFRPPGMGMFVVGYRRSYNSSGVQDGLILSGGL